MENTTNSFNQSVDDLYAGTSPMPAVTDLGLTDPSPDPMQVKQRVAGASPKPLPSQVPPGTKKTFDPRAEMTAMRNYLDAEVYAADDKNEWSKAYGYNPGPNGGAFYDKYAPLQEYGKLEFHPTYNNAELFDKNTTFLGDMKRTMTQSFIPLVWNGVKSTFASTARIFNQGDFLGEDAKLARDYAYYTAKSYSTKDNLGSFINNLTMNFGYTVGIMGTAIFENWAGALIGGLGGAKTATQASARLAFKEYQAGKSFDGLQSYSSMLDKMKDITEVRKAFNEANKIGRLERAVTSPVGKVLNPFSNLADNYYSALKNPSEFTGYMQSSRNMMNTAGAAYRDFRNMNLAVSEARLEAGMVYNNMTNDLYNKFYSNNGRVPNDDEMKDIIAQAKQAAYETSGMNAGLIYLTNKISFDNILNPRVGSQGFLKQRVQDWKTIGGSKSFGDLGSIGLDAAKNEWKFYDKGFKSWWKGWKTDPFSKSVLNTVGYFKRNLTEGIQESLQETISAANESYYKDSYYTTPVRKNLISKAVFGKGTTPLSYYGKGLAEQASSEGLATFASGFAMGSLAGGLNKSMTYLYEKGNQIYDPKGYEKYKTEKSKIVTELVDKMNSMGVEDFLNSKLLSGGTQDILARVQTSGNKKEVMDAESEALVDHISTMLDYGVFDMYMENFESYKQMTDTEFEEAFPKVPKGEAGKYKGRIDEVVDKAKKIKDRYDVYTKQYPNPIDLTKYDKEDYDYEDAYMMKYMWDWGVKSAVFYNETFDNTRERMVGIMDKHYSERPLKSMTKRQSDIILRPEEMKNEIGLLNNEIKNLIAVGDPVSKEAAKAKKKEVDSLQQYYDAYQEFSIYYHRDRYYNRAKGILQQQKAEGENVTDEEIQEFLDNQFGPKTTETEQDLLLGLEESYNKLLRSISGKPDDYLFTDKVDDAFEMVLDFYKLNDESREMVDYINLLHDPNGFVDVYKRNLKWMNDLWFKRGDYYRDIVTKELSDIEDNGLLNYLAKMGIFMEANDFILYRDQGMPPKEFYDEKKQLVIPEGSLAYDRYMEVLKRYDGIKAIEEFVKDQAKNSELEIRIAELQERKKTQLDKAEEMFEENLLATTGESREDWEKKETPESTGRTKEEIDAEIEGLKANLKLIDETTDIEEILSLYEAYAEQGLIPANYTDIVDEELADNETAVKFFKSTKQSGAPIEARQQATGIKFALPRILKDKIAELSVEEPKQEGSSVPPIQTTEAYADYQKSIKKINERYDEFVAKLKAQMAQQTAEAVAKAKPAPSKVNKVEVSTSTKWDELPDDFKTELQQIFDDYLVKPSPEGLGQPANLRRDNPTRYELIRNNWFEQQSDLVDEYNKREVVKREVKIKYLTLKKPIDEYGLTQLRNLRDTLQGFIDTNTDNDGNALDNNDKAAIKNDIAELQYVIKERRSTYVPKDNSERVFRIFEEMVANRQNGVSRVLDSEGNTIAYEFPDVDGTPMRVTKLTEEIENKMEGKEPYLYDAIKETYTDEKGNRRGGQLLNLFRELKNDNDIKSDEERLNKFMSALATTVKDGKLAQLNSQRKLDIIRNGLTNNFTEEALIAVVKGVANDESTIAGNTIDRMVRDSFKVQPDGGFVKPEKPAKMSQQAYDNLFGDYGIITELQDKVIDGKYKILSDDVIIYDQTLLESGLVGAMDLVAFDQETGQLMIIDVKTGKPENWDNFNSDKGFSKKLTYRIQQSIYRAILFNMTGELASKIAILPVSIITDKDGNIESAESAAPKINRGLVREIENKIIALKEASKPDQAKIKELENQIKTLKKSITVALEPVKEIEDYGVVMKQPELPENLKPEAVGKKTTPDTQMTPEKKAAEVKKLNKRLTDINKKLAALKDGGVITLGNTITMSPEYDALKLKKDQVEAELKRLGEEPTETKEDKSDLDDEINALRKGVTDVFPSSDTLSSEEFKGYINDIRSAKTLLELQEAYDNAIFMIMSESDIVFSDMLENAYNLKLLALQVNTAQENLAKGEYLISKNPIFTDSTDEIVVIAKIGDGKVVVKEIGVKKPRQRTFTDAQIQASFTKTTAEALKQDEEDMSVTIEEKQNAAISKSSIEAFAQNPELINKANKNAEKSQSERFAALKNASENDNINECKPK